jgi:hypothetical protein
MNWISEGLKVGDVVWVGGTGELRPLRVIRITKSAVFVRHQRVGEDRYNLRDGYPHGDAGFRWTRCERRLKRDSDEIRTEYRKQAERDMVYNLTKHMNVRCETLSKLLEYMDSIRDEVKAKVDMFTLKDMADGGLVRCLIQQKLDAHDEEWERVKEEMAKEAKK